VADLKDRSSLRSACKDVDVVISTASATLSHQEGDTIQTVDEQGQLALVDVAEEAGVKHFVFVSLAPQTVPHVLSKAKRKVEERLRTSRMSFTVLQPTPFCEIWLSPALGFNPLGGTARLFGTGEQPVSWIALHDVARFAVAAAAGDRLAGKMIALGGPDALSPLQVVKIFEELGTPRIALEHVPASVLEAQMAAATDPFAETFAALTLSNARGMVVDPRPALELVAGRLQTVREYAQRILAGSRQPSKTGENHD
jgi:NADH dehydrogenase